MYYRHILITIYLTCLVVILVLSNPSIKASDLANTQSLGGLSQGSLTMKRMTAMPMAFTANQGQWDDKVSFRANAGGATMWFASDGAYYQFTRTIKTDDDGPYSIVDMRSQTASGRQTFPSAPDMAREPEQYETMMIKANFVGANANPIMRGVDMLEYKCNYFIGNDPDEWHTDVPNYSAVVYEKIYDGIDLKYYGNGQQMEYDFIVSPGADFSQIKIQYEGAESISVNTDGELVVTTKWGEVIEQRPIIYQIENGSRVAVAGAYSLKGASAFGFELSGYNPELPLVIDPVLSYSTYLGGATAGSSGYVIAVDASGAAYVAGTTNSTDFPMEDPFQETMPSINFSAFITKFSSSGNSIIYSTFLGGSEWNLCYSIAVDASGNAYVIGLTKSTDFPTLNAYQGTNQGFDDVFVTKLSSSGSSLVYSTYLGGSDDDFGFAIAIDATGAAYVTGWTSSTDFPTLNPYQVTFQGNDDVFVTKLSSSGSSLVYSTYLGGSDYDYCYRIAVDSSGAAYVTGGTESSDFPTLNPFQETNQGFRNAFVTKLSSSGNNLIYSTYLGGSSDDRCYGIAIDATGAAYVAGWTSSTDFPTLNPYTETLHGSSDAFVTKLNSSGNSLVYSTYLGGSDADNCEDIAVDASGAAYITGITRSTDFPTLSQYQEDQGGTDAYITKLSSSGNSLIYSTYLGGGDYDHGRGIAVDASGAAYVTGYTNSTDFPTVNPYQEYPGDGAFVSKLIAPSCINQRGNANNDPEDKANVADISYLVSWLFGIPSGPAPASIEEANANGDAEEKANVSDVSYLVAWLFGIPSGPPPPACP